MKASKFKKMARKIFLSTTLLTFFSSLVISSSLADLHQNPSTTKTTGTTSAEEFIRSKCNSTDYPSLCITSLSSYAPQIHNNPLQLADAALNVTLAGAESTSAMMSRLSSSNRRMPPREAEAVSDCVETLKDSVIYLRQSLREMGRLHRGPEVMERIGDVQTWVSTALTDESTCMDGFAGDSNGVVAPPSTRNLKSAFRGRVVRVAQLTSNALAIVNELAPPSP